MEYVEDIEKLMERAEWMVATNFSVAWQSKLLKKRLLEMTFHGRPLYADDKDFEFWTRHHFSQLAKRKTVDEIIDEAWDYYYAGLEV